MTNNEDQIKDLEKREVLLDTALALYNMLLSIYKNQYNKLTKAHKKRIKFQNMPENLPIDLDLDENNLQPMPALKGNEKVKLDPEQALLFIFVIML